MNKLFLLFILLLSALSADAQSSAVVAYQWNDAFGHAPKFQLLINENISVFRHHQPSVDYTIGASMEITIGHNHFDFWYDHGKQRLLETRETIQNVATQASWDPAEMNWEITNETKSYRGYTVQKAITKAHLTCEPEYTFGNAIAWFAIDLPFPTGPMRYYGLPGLIVELTFTERGQTCLMTDISFKETECLEWPTANSGLLITKEQTLFPSLISGKELRNYTKTGSKK
jgi:GLPGLI family protein